MEILLQDLRYTFRALSRTPGFVAVAVVTLALGIGANTAIFSVVNRLLFRPLPFLESDRLTAVWSTGPRGNDHNEASVADFRDWREQAKSFDHLVAHVWWTANFTGGDQPERIQGFRVTADYFDALGIRPALGRAFVAGDDQPGHDRLVILSDGLWRRRFGANPAVLGTTVSINGFERTIVGVLPPGVRYPVAGEAWAPLAFAPADAGARRAHYLLVTGRLAPGRTLADAQAEMAGLSARLAAAYPETNTGWGSNVRPLIPDMNRMLTPILAVLFAAVGFVLLIACANVANLMLARAGGRRRELAIRIAVGAARGRITRLVLTESLVLAVAGGVAGVIVGIWGVDLLVSLVPPQHQRFMAGFDLVGVDGQVLAFTAGLAALSALLFGWVPAMRAARTDANEPLRGATIGGRDKHRLRRALVGAEVALALLLLLGAGLTFRTFRHLASLEPGFDGNNVALTAFALPARTYANDSDVVRFTDALTARVRALPGVLAAGTTNIVPMCSCNSTSGFAIAGAPPFPPGEGPEVYWRSVTPGYFRAMGIPLRQGRLFEASDDRSAVDVVLVNEVVSRRWFPDGGALGRLLYVGGDTTRPARVVGIVGDIRHDGFSRGPGPELYVSAAQRPETGLTLVVRTANDPAAMLPALRRVVAELDRDLPVYDQTTMREVMDLSVGQYTFSMRLLGTLGFIALVLAAVGIYGVISHLVTERTREIGVRIALGGDESSVRALVVRQGMTPALTGLGAGLVAALALTRAMTALMVGVSPRDPLTFGAVALVLLLVALAACWMPARRAARVDPMVALRTE